MPEFTGTKDLRSHLRILWRWKVLFLLVLIVVPLAAYLIERGKPKTYQASALVGVNQATVDTSLVNGGGSFSTTNVTAIAELVTTAPVAQVAAGLMHPPGNPAQIAGEVSASGDQITNFITIKAVDHKPARAAAVANAFAHAISLNRQKAAVGELQSAIKGVQAQLANLGTSNGALRLQLQQQLSQLRAAVDTQGSVAAILQPATAGALAGPKTRRTVEIGIVIGLLLAFGAVALAENADRRLRTPDDLEGTTELQTLAAIPPTAFSGELTTSVEDEEAFQMLRTSLLYFNADRRLASILVTSPGEKDGKTTVATRLALASARAGMNVALIDADLRRAQVSSRLGLQSDTGLAAVLSGHATMPETLVDYPVSEPQSGRLTVLPAGPPPANPSALMASRNMRDTLRALESENDIVIVDSPAALAVSDPVPLMSEVTGVVLVARMNRSNRHTIRRLQRMIQSAHGTLVGVVATGVNSGPGYDTYTPKHYTQNGSNGSRAERFRRRVRKTPKPAPEPSIELHAPPGASTSPPRSAKDAEAG